MLKRINLGYTFHKLETAQIVHKEIVFSSDSMSFLITLKPQGQL